MKMYLFVLFCNVQIQISAPSHLFPLVWQRRATFYGPHWLANSCVVTLRCDWQKKKKRRARFILFTKISLIFLDFVTQMRKNGG